MNPEEILAHVDREPFVPFRLRMSSGRRFDIKHPENIKVGEDSVHVYVYSQKDKRLYERVVILGLSLMESIEPVDATLTGDAS
ncbi:MAG: hypothetical protein AAGJ97_00185 [Planctomycetota bacterium]